jgi:predicted transcriptional regulator
MDSDTLEGIASSRVRLRIASLLSTRPRTLRELSHLTGISVQGVLKHLEKLEEMGVLEVKRVGSATFPARKVYRLAGVHVGDFSLDDVIIVKASEKRGVEASPGKDVYRELESYAEDALILRRRIRDQARKLSRMIDELVQDESRINSIVESLGFQEAEKLALHAIFTEESLDDAAEVLRRHYGEVDPKRRISELMLRLRENGKK